MMTKTRKQQLARQARAHGYFQRGRQLEVSCPLCKRRVIGSWSPYAGTTITQLDAIVTAHLTGDCEAAS